MIILAFIVGIILIFGTLIALVMLWRDGEFLGRVAMTGISHVGTVLALSFIGLPFPIPLICGLIVATAVWKSGKRRAFN